MPSPSFSRAIQLGVDLLRGKRRVKGPRFTEESVQATFESGEVVVRERTLPVTGEVRGRVRPGDAVTVAWSKGQPKAIVKHRARRAQQGGVGEVGLALVEELFLTEIGDPAVLQVWFRNGDQFIPIDFVTAEGEPGDSPTDLGFQGGGPAWGRGDADYFVFQGTLTAGGDRAMAVYQLNRTEKNEPYDEGATVQATLVRLYNLVTDATTFGTMTVSASDIGLTQTGSASGAVKYVAQYSKLGGGGPTDPPYAVKVKYLTAFAGIAPNADLLVTIQIRGSAPVGELNRTSAVFEMGMLLVNVTRGIVLANHLATSLGATIYVTPVSSSVCLAVGTSSCSTSLGGLLANSGAVTLLSLTGTNLDAPSDQTVPGTFKNYALVSPAVVFVEAVRIESPPGVPIGEIFCNPTRPTVLLSILGELAEGNSGFASFAGSALGPVAALRPKLQGSDTQLIWAPYTERDVLAGSLQFRDLANAESAPVGGDADDLFGLALSGPNVNRPLIFLTEGSLIYKGFDDEAPFTNTFFVSPPDADAGVTLDLDDLAPDEARADQAVLAPAEEETELLLAQVGTREIQVLQSVTL